MWNHICHIHNHAHVVGRSCYQSVSYKLCKSGQWRHIPISLKMIFIFISALTLSVLTAFSPSASIILLHHNQYFNLLCDLQKHMPVEKHNAMMHYYLHYFLFNVYIVHLVNFGVLLLFLYIQIIHWYQIEKIGLTFEEHLK